MGILEFNVWSGVEWSYQRLNFCESIQLAGFGFFQGSRDQRVHGLICPLPINFLRERGVSVSLSRGGVVMEDESGSIWKLLGGVCFINNGSKWCKNEDLIVAVANPTLKGGFQRWFGLEYSESHSLLFFFFFFSSIRT